MWWSRPTDPASRVSRSWDARGEGQEAAAHQAGIDPVAVDTSVDPSAALASSSEEQTSGLKPPTPQAVSPKKRTVQAVNLHLRAQMPESALLKLRNLLDQHPGQYRVYFSVEHPVKQKILTSYRIGFDDLLAKELEGLLGTDTVKAEV